MRKLLAGFLTTITVVALLAGCSSDAGEYTNVEVASEDHLSNNEYVDVPYEQLLYSKTSDTFTWDQNKSDVEIGEEILDQYEKLKKAVPGGFVVEETANEYYICISAEEKSSPQEGFRIQSLSISDDDQRAATALIIKLEPTTNEQVTDPYEGRVFVTSLVSIAKKDLPKGAMINEISMTGS